MSEQAPEAPPGGGGGNVFKRKIGPLPMWAWLAIGAAIIGLYVIWRKNQASQAAASSTAGTSTPASDVPQFINQTYTTVTPPAAPAPVAAATPGPVTNPGGVNRPHPTNPGGPDRPPGPISRPRQITATGEDTGDINQIAKRYGLTEQELIRANPELRKIKVRVGRKSVPLIGSGAPIPKGTIVRIPPA